MKRRIVTVIIAGFLALMALAAQGSAAPRFRQGVALAPAAPSPSALLLQSEPSPAESRENTYRIINFLIMAAALVYLLRQPLKDFFADRNDEIHRALEEGRKALAAADARLAEVEGKLNSLANEIATFKAESERAMVAERERLKQAAEAEAGRLMEFARTQIESATRAAKADLKRYTAGQAVELAEAAIRQRLDDPARRGLVARFVRDLKNPGVQN